MASAEWRDKFELLHRLLLEERERAKTLDMEGLQQVVARKEALLVGLNPQPEEIRGLEELLRQIDHENRRNAYLLWTGLGWVREMMGFFGRATSQSTYGLKGQRCSHQTEGRLLSGKV